MGSNDGQREQGFDGVDAAWEEFGSRLEQRIRDLGDGEVVLVEALDVDEDDGAAPYIQVIVYDEGDDEPVVRCEAVSNEYLKDALQLDAAQQLQLEEIGFRAPTSSDDEGGSLNYFCDCDQVAAGYSQSSRFGPCARCTASPTRPSWSPTKSWSRRRPPASRRQSARRPASTWSR